MTRTRRTGPPRTAAPSRAPAARRAALLGALVTAGLALAGCSTAPGAAAERPAAAAPPLTGEAASPDPGSAPADPADPDGGAEADGTDGTDGLDAELVARFEAARAAAAAEDVTLTITSGRRTPEEQQRLVDEAIDEYGVPEAYRWVLPPERSAHVQGLAIDVGPTQGAYWLAEHGVEFGLCQTYANEIWHAEKLPEGAETCPEPRPDSSWGW